MSGKFPGRPEILINHREVTMLREVRIFDPNGNLKKVISPETLTKRRWKKHNEDEEKITLMSTAKLKTPKWLKEKLDIEFPELDNPSFH
ncbi:hypothetical protein UZ36_04120 [Candidatus Nitromaritima sp. SCGC AAA799-C22]|nr:hypothetical protein UZ36_04120 [Candidatus Nitromaritima sp. SCGC AAA799-C22]